MDIQVETTDTNAVDDFDAAFETAIGEPSAPAPAQAPAAAAPAKENADEPAATDAPGTGTPAKDSPNKDAPAEPAPAEPAPAEPAKPTEPAKPDVAPAPAEPAPAPAAPQNLDPKFLAQAIAEATAEQAKQNAQPQAPAAPVAAKPEDFYTPEDTAAIAEFAKDWPTEHKAVQSMMKGAIQAAVQNRVSELVGDLNKVLTPLFEQTEQVQQTSFQTFVTSKHPDAVQVLPDVQAWIREQPSLYQPGLQAVYDKGNAQQLVELLDLFKQAKGSTGAAPQPPASSAAQEPVQPKPRTAPAPAAVAALAAVPAGQRSKPTAGPDVNNYDDAFEEAIGLTAP